MNERERKMAEAPLLPTMLSMGIPIFIAQFISILYNIVDRIFIGHIAGTGSLALTGVGLCLPVIIAINAFAGLVGSGGAPQAGIALGQQDRDKAERILGNGTSMLIIMAVVLTVVLELVKKPCLYLYGASDATYVYSEQYLTIYLLGTIFVMLTLGLNTFITVQGAAMTAMITTLIGAVLNLILDPIFIFVLGLGVQGAAIATVISQAVSAVWILIFLNSGKASLRIHTDKMKLESTTVRDILKLGVSPFVMSLTESLINVVYNSGAARYGGDVYVGSITILQSVMQMIFTPLCGFAAGVQPIISYNYGARNMDRVKKACRALILTCFIFSNLCTVVTLIFPSQIASIFTTDQELIDVCTRALPIFMAGMLVFGLQTGSQTSFMALSKAKQSLFFAIFRKIILLIPLAIILPAATGSVWGLYVAEPISDAVAGITCVTVFVLSMKKEFNAVE